MSAAVAGIHFGNTNCYVAVSKEGKITTVSNELGTRMTPTMLAYTGNEKIIGQDAKQFSVRNPTSCITNIKSCIGDSFHEEAVNEVEKYCSCPIRLQNGEICHCITVEEDSLNVSTAEALSYILTKLLEIAESFGGDELEDVVITTPHSFSDQQKMSIVEAAEKIGFNVLRVISESAAALLAYGIGQNDNMENYNILVFRLGGSSCDVSLVNVNSGMYHVIAESRKPHYGANQFDEILVENFANEFKRKYKEDITDNRKAMGKLRAVCEECKLTLSRKETSPITVDSLYDGLDFQSNITRIKFESMASPVITEFMNFVGDFLKSKNIHKDSIAKVALVGGGTGVPKLVSTFKSYFASSELIDNRNADEIICHGAAMQASILQTSRQVEKTPKLKCLSRNIGIKVANSKFEAILSQSTPIPCQMKKTFLIPPNQKSISVPIYEWESSPKDAKIIAKFAVHDITAKSEEQEVQLSFLVNKLDNITAILSVGDSKHNLQISNECHKT